MGTTETSFYCYLRGIFSMFLYDMFVSLRYFVLNEENFEKINLKIFYKEKIVLFIWLFIKDTNVSLRYFFKKSCKSV